MNLTPGFGLKLISGPIIQFMYGFQIWAQTTFTSVYLVFYGLGRLVSPLVCRRVLDVRKYYLAYSCCSAAFLLASPGTVFGLPSPVWPDPLPFCFFVSTQGFFMGGFKGLQPTMLKGLWCWMDGDPAYSWYDSQATFQNAVGMTNFALTLAGAIGPVTAYCSYIAPDGSQNLLSQSAVESNLWQIWFYCAGACQIFAGLLMYLPKGIVHFDPQNILDGTSASSDARSTEGRRRTSKILATTTTK